MTRFPGNARRGNVAEIRKSIRRHGQYRAIVVRECPDGSRVILAGNHTADALEAEGHETARCELIECSDDEARRINLADNRMSDIAEDDDRALAELLAALDGDLDGTGWDVYDLDGLADALGDEGTAGDGTPPRGENGEPHADPDEVPEPPLVTISRPGDRWKLGDHILMCGNSMNRADVALLMDGRRADVMVTDPPYGVAFGGDKGKNSISGDLTQAAIPVSFALALEVLTDDARIYLFGGSGNWSMYAGLFDAHLRMQVHPIVWVKNGFVLRPLNYHSSFEMVYFGWKGKGGQAAFWYGDRSQTDVWHVARDAPGDKRHPTQKPVEVCAIPIRNSCPPGGLVYEPFGGSGSTLIAAHETGRTARVMELDPKYADVICCRFQQHAGITPERVLPDGTTEPVTFT